MKAGNINTNIIADEHSKFIRQYDILKVLVDPNADNESYKLPTGNEHTTASIIRILGIRLMSLIACVGLGLKSC